MPTPSEIAAAANTEAILFFIVCILVSKVDPANENPAPRNCRRLQKRSCTETEPDVHLKFTQGRPGGFDFSVLNNMSASGYKLLKISVESAKRPSASVCPTLPWTLIPAASDEYDSNEQAVAFVGVSSMAAGFYGWRNFKNS